MASRSPLVVGVDAGGTSTRCVVATGDGEVLARSRAGGANIRSARDPGGNLLRALTEALAAIGPAGGPGDVVAGVLGLAGASAAGRRRSSEMSARAWRGAGLRGLPVVVPDILVSFAGATPEPAGSALVAGTGAVAARIEHREMVRRCDGYGWLLGDEGSGVWIGRRAAQAALTALDGRGAPTALTHRVLPALLGGPFPGPPPEDRDTPRESEAGPLGDAGAPPEGEALAQAIIAAVYDGEPARLGLLSPVVETAAREGDRVARAILRDAARALLRTLDGLGPAVPGQPVVLAGSLLTNPTTVAAQVGKALTGRPVLLARDGAAGAAALALRAAAESGRLPLAPSALETAHRRLLAS
ncbi:BadF/BadG/BcrA/BcrD ATPase family protein [Sphaerisporangium sp. TRM90804]|uniref:N-acetylglucosamine kinase n=1 Tax=Sphaerisporangium sp. TRM90804 TaxID=3031113 RepID=UPI00244B2976|nr:BadF/BadG/BcrA/BcrD ATPase family protein [Sphaerisporangium sp. TRM90804]MDH2427265.1 BadF/BadG/BcrA/BcrD ATPase family protein [Sphaerisporangium sp. TRM90804]